MITASKVSEVTRTLLLFSDYSDRYIGRITDSSHQSVGRIRWKLSALKATWTDIEFLSCTELNILLYPKKKYRVPAKVLPDFDYIYQEIMKKGKRRKSFRVLHDEYRLKHGDVAYKRSQFNQLVRESLAARHVVMKQQYYPGEMLFIDYAGTRVKYREKGEDILLNVFVCCMGYSKKLFAFATKDMSSDSWILSLVNALAYYGGTPEVIQFDNAKAMVTKAKKIALLNDNAIAFAQHYGCMCDTSRVATPTDNPNAEAAVKFITQRILVSMNSDFTFFSLPEVNSHLAQQVEVLNAQPFQKRPESRNQLFSAEEKTTLTPLPDLPLIPFIMQKQIKVPSTYLLPYQGHEYSVPYTLVGKTVTLRVTEHKLIIFFDGKPVVSHVLSKSMSGFTRLDEHMKPTHLAEERKSKTNFLAWAKGIGQDVEKVIERQYEQTSNAKSRVVGKHCIELQKLCDTCGEDVFSAACHYALTRNWYEPSDIELVIRAKAWERSIEPVAIAHANIRGKTYFEGKHHE